MPIPSNITFHGIASSEALENHIREKIETLGQLHPNLTRCNVTIEKPHHHKHQGNTFNVRIDLYVPGNEIVVNRDAHEDVLRVLIQEQAKLLMLPGVRLFCTPRKSAVTSNAIRCRAA